MIINILGILAISIVILLGTRNIDNIKKPAKISSQKPTVVNEKVTPSPIPTLTLTPTQKILPSATPTQTNLSSATIQYPNSKEISRNGNTKVFESNDAPDIITNWYKEQIKNQGYNATSFVQTNTNGNVLNKLAAAKKDGKIEVEIRKSNNSEPTIITVTSN